MTRSVQGIDADSQDKAKTDIDTVDLTEKASSDIKGASTDDDAIKNAPRLLAIVNGAGNPRVKISYPHPYPPKPWVPALTNKGFKEVSRVLKKIILFITVQPLQ
jgi:hypothetical protein